MGKPPRPNGKVSQSRATRITPGMTMAEFATLENERLGYHKWKPKVTHEHAQRCKGGRVIERPPIDRPILAHAATTSALSLPSARPASRSLSRPSSAASFRSEQRSDAPPSGRSGHSGARPVSAPSARSPSARRPPSPATPATQASSSRLKQAEPQDDIDPALIAKFMASYMPGDEEWWHQVRMTPASFLPL